MYVATMSDLLNLSSPSDTEDYFLEGYHIIGDGGGGHFRYRDEDLTSSAFPHLYEDHGTVLQSNVAEGYFVRTIYTPYISVKWFGAYGDGIRDDIGAIRYAFNACKVAWEAIVNGSAEMSVVGTTIPVHDGSRTTIFFPAGVYLISSPIADLESHTTITHPFPAYYLRIEGENSIIRPTDDFNDLWGGHYALSLDNTWFTEIKNITFTSFRRAISLYKSPTLDAGVMVIEKVTFSDIQVESVLIDCQSSNVIFRDCSWRSVGHAITGGADKITVTGGWVENQPFAGDDQAVFDVGGTFLIKDIIMVETPSDYNLTGAWIKFRGGSVYVKNCRCGGEFGGLPIVNSYAVGKTWSFVGGEPMVISIKDSYIPSTGRPAVRLFEVPNAIVLENNTGFTDLSWPIAPCIEWVGSPGGLEARLKEMTELFTIKLDNTVFHGQGFGCNKIYLPGCSKEQLVLLPYIRLNNGLDSYGYAEGVAREDRPSNATDLVFFQGLKSDRSYNDSAFGAINHSYSYEIRLSNVYADSLYEYSSYRVEVFNSTISNVVLLSGGTNANAPIVFQTPGDMDLLKVWTVSGKSYEIYYQIHNLITPVSLPY